MSGVCRRRWSIEPARQQLRAGLRIGLPATILALVAQFATSVVVARSLSVEAFGVLSTALAVVALLSIMSDHLAKQTERLAHPATARQLMRPAFLWGLVTACALGAALLILPTSRFHAPLAAYLPVVAFAAPLAVLLGSAAAAGGTPLASAKLTPSLARLSIVGLLAVTTALSPTRVAWADGAAAAVTFATMAMLLRRRLSGAAGSSPSLPSGILRSGVALAIVGASAVVLQRLDLVMLAGLEGAGSAGTYDIALRISSFPLVLHGAALSAYIPSLTKLPDGPALRRHYKDATLASLTVVMPLVIALAVYGDVATHVVFGARYALSPLVYALLAGSILIHSLFGPNGSTLISRHRDYDLMWLSLGMIVLNVVLNALLIPVLGVGGAALATGIAFLMTNVSLSLLLRAHTGGRIGSAAWLRPAGLAGSVGLAAAIAPRVFLGPRISSALVGGGLAAAATTVLLSSNIPWPRQSPAADASDPDTREET